MTTTAPPPPGDVEATIPHLLEWLEDKHHHLPDWVVEALNTVDINARNVAFMRATKGAPERGKLLKSAAAAIRRKHRNGTYHRSGRRSTTSVEGDHRCDTIRSHYTTAGGGGLIFIHEAIQ
jgi:hypothetical protein